MHEVELIADTCTVHKFGSPILHFQSGTMIYLGLHVLHCAHACAISEVYVGLEACHLLSTSGDRREVTFSLLPFSSSSIFP